MRCSRHNHCDAAVKLFTSEKLYGSRQMLAHCLETLPCEQVLLLARFLGMAEKNNQQLLRLLGLPVFEGLADLAAEMHLEQRRLKLFIIYSKDAHYYKRYHVPKRSGGTRLISQPGARLKAVQAWALRNILDKLSPSPYATAFRPGQGIWHAMLPHEENRYFLTLDIVDFFPSITRRSVEQIFRAIGYGTIPADILAALCTCAGTLPQGGVTSPALSNLAASRLDRRLAGYTSKRNIAYTRYADDFTFSTSTPGVLQRILPFVRKIVEDEGFEINAAKTRFLGPRQRCRMLGVTKNNSRPGFGVGMRAKRTIRAVLYNAIVHNRFTTEFPDFISISGWISFARSIEPEIGDYFAAYAAKLEETAGKRYAASPPPSDED